MKQDNASSLLVPTKKVSRLNFLSHREIAELPNLLLPDEEVLVMVSGFYTAGPATLCVTSKRLLLVDKKLLRLSYEDIRYESIKEVNYSRQSFIASVKFYYAGRSLQFRSWYHRELRVLAQYAQHKTFEVSEMAEDVSRILETERNTQPTHIPIIKDQQLAHYLSSEQFEYYLKQRLARWRRAGKFLTQHVSA